mmetsp:Transcript_1726/g.3189  ORF Transcript_1726/g.3189 Transcript_1726/m.3189 type:complete len:472 (-) Transcript_1726:30-1445(-)
MNNLLLLFLTLLINTSLPFTFTLTRTRLFGPLKASPGKGAGDNRGLEDRNVPTEHKGLPDALGDGKAHGAAGAMSPTEVTDAFKAQSALPPPPPPTLTEDRVLPYQVLLRGLEGGASKVAAVYAVYSSPSGSASTCCHVGVTRNLAVTLRSHVNSDKAPKCKSVRAASFTYPQRTAMEEMKAKWIKDFEWDGASLEDGWVETPAAAAEAGMTEEERNEFESKKNKTRRAMADSTLVDEAEEMDEAKRRLEMMKASGFLDSDDDEDDDDDDDEFGENDDWPALIQEQTSENESSPSAPVSSPFSSSPSVSSSTDAPSGDLELTVANVDSVLESVRPYLISDGGNVAVSAVDSNTGNVMLILQGACGSCPSSTVTMKMGIERVLKENFKGLGEVISVPDPDSADLGPTMETVGAAVDALKPAITAMGGVVEVRSVSELGVVNMLFRGPNKVRYGLEQAVLDVKGVRHVEFVEE